MASLLSKLTNSLKLIKESVEKQVEVAKKSTTTKPTSTTNTSKNVVINPSVNKTQSSSNVVIKPTTTTTKVDTTPSVNIEELIADKRQYTLLKDDVETMINRLNNCIKYLETPANTIASTYTIDNVAIDKGKIKTIRQDLISKRNFLSNEVLVEINLKIKEISEVIS